MKRSRAPKGSHSPWKAAIVTLAFAVTLVVVFVTTGLAQQDSPSQLELDRQAVDEAERRFKEEHSQKTPLPADEVDDYLESLGPIGTPQLWLGAPAGDGEILDEPANLYLRGVDLLNT